MSDKECATVVAMLKDALQELLRAGEHDGPCDEGSDWDGCEQHLAASARRREHARNVLARLTGDAPQGAKRLSEADLIIRDHWGYREGGRW